MVDDLLIPLPPLDEQRRIATILDASDALRAKRRAALDKLDTLAQAIFLEEFGDPIVNPKGWSSVPFSEILLRIDSGNSPICLDRPAEGDEWGILKLGAITWCEFDPKQNKALPPDRSPDHALEVKPGDLLFSRKNTSELVAACALVRQTPPRLLLPDLIFRLYLRSDAPIKPDFLFYLLINPKKRREIQKLAGGSAGSMPNISKEKLRTVAILVPPLPLQRNFGRIAEALDKQKAAHRESLLKLDILFASLQNRAFRGEL
jgi:type I restriction enzyme S subunit